MCRRLARGGNDEVLGDLFSLSLSELSGAVCFANCSEPFELVVNVTMWEVVEMAVPFPESGCVLSIQASSNSKTKPKC
jgi:hypothetical protein